MTNIIEGCETRRIRKRAIGKAWYARHKDKINEVRRLNWKKNSAEVKRQRYQKDGWRARGIYDENRLYVIAYKRAHPCVDCGINNPIVLDFDHRDPKTNEFSIAHAMHAKWETLYAEIEKCDVRCSNCHRIKTHEDLIKRGLRNYY